MHLIRLESSEDPMFQEAIALYQNSFPKHEQRDDRSQREVFQCSEYHFQLIYDETVFVGILLYWETPEFIYLEHFCVNPKLRNQHYGKRALELLRKEEKTIILEIDPPSDEWSIRRRAFYERSGYLENRYEHIHPPYHPRYSGHELVVLSYPNLLTQTSYDRFVSYLRDRVMGNCSR